MYVYKKINVSIHNYKYSNNCMYTQLYLLIETCVYTSINDSENNQNFYKRNLFKITKQIMLQTKPTFIKSMTFGVYKY